MSKYFAGIRPTAPGWDEFLIEPQTDVCKEIDCTVPTVKGYIRLSVHKTDRALALDVHVPKDTTARLCLPFADGQTVFCGGEAIYADGRFVGADGLSFEKAGNGCLVLSFKAAGDTAMRFEVRD